MASRTFMTGIAGAALAGLLAACGSGAGTTGTAASGAANGQSGGITISTRTVPGIGTVLTDQSGMTLYTPQQEARGVIKCTGGCLSFWFPVTVGNGAAPHATAGLAGTLGSIQRPGNGGHQLTFNGKPLYTFRLDVAPGQAHGNDFTDHFGGQTFTWHAVTSAGGAAGPGQPGSSSSSNPYQGGSAGY